MVEAILFLFYAGPVFFGFSALFKKRFCKAWFYWAGFWKRVSYPWFWVYPKPCWCISGGAGNLRVGRKMDVSWHAAIACQTRKWRFGTPPLPAKRESEGLACRHCLPNEKVRVWHAAIAGPLSFNESCPTKKGGFDHLIKGCPIEKGRFDHLMKGCPTEKGRFNHLMKGCPTEKRGFDHLMKASLTKKKPVII